MHFSVYSKTYETNEGLIYKKHFIVLKDEFGTILEWTDFHKYITPVTPNSDRIQKNIKKKFDYVVIFLNYVYFEENITSLSNIDKKMVERFLNAYGQIKLKNDNVTTHRNIKTVNKCKDCIIAFIENLIVSKQMNRIRTNDLYSYKNVFNYKDRKFEKKMIDNFEITCVDNYDKIFRDITYKAMNIIMRQIETKHKNILGSTTLQKNVGLRTSESLNVRREDSPLGAGIEFEIIDGKVMNAYINIQREYNLRSDLISVGGIKKERKQKIHPLFLGDFCREYQIYMQYLEGKKYEEDYGPLSINRNGKAMTYASYYYHFKNVIQEVIPIMLASNDEELVAYGIMIQQYGLSPHIFRHYFSMCLSDNGASISEMMEFRGDKSPESALVYLQNKSDLTRKLEKVNNETFAYNLWKASKKYSNEDDD